MHNSQHSRNVLNALDIGVDVQSAAHAGGIAQDWLRSASRSPQWASSRMAQNGLHCFRQNRSVEEPVLSVAPSLHPININTINTSSYSLRTASINISFVMYALIDPVDVASFVQLIRRAAHVLRSSSIVVGCHLWF
jgi:hypothetical protein